MKFLALVLFFASVRPVPHAPDPPITNHDQLIERIEQKFIGNEKLIAIGVGGPFKKAVVDWVTPEFRPAVIEYLKNKAKDPKYLERTQRALIALDDEETVLKAIRQFDDGSLEPASILWQNLQVERIKDLIPVVYGGSDTPRIADALDLKSPRYHAIDFSLGLIESSERFSQEQRQWASGLGSNSHNDGPDPHIMWLFKQWWEHNKSAILAGNYSDAKWVPTYKGQPDCYNKNIRNEPGYRTYTAATRNDILPIPKVASIIPETKTTSPVTQTPPPATVTPTQKTNRLFVYVGLGLLAFLTCAWVWLKKAKA